MTEIVFDEFDVDEINVPKTKSMRCSWCNILDKHNIEIQFSNKEANYIYQI